MSLPQPRRASAAARVPLDALFRDAGLPRWSAEQWAGEWAHPGGRIWWIPDRGAALAGLVVRCAADEAEILQLAVAPAARRQGAASLLLDAFRSAEPQIDRMFLEVRASNDPAQAFYRAVGFEEVGRRVGYYVDREDAIVMARPLTKPVGNPAG